LPITHSLIPIYRLNRVNALTLYRMIIAGTNSTLADVSTRY